MELDKRIQEKKIISGLTCFLKTAKLEFGLRQRHTPNFVSSTMIRQKLTSRCVLKEKFFFLLSNTGSV